MALDTTNQLEHVVFVPTPVLRPRQQVENQIRNAILSGQFGQVIAYQGLRCVRVCPACWGAARCAGQACPADGVVPQRAGQTAPAGYVGAGGNGMGVTAGA